MSPPGSARLSRRSRADLERDAGETRNILITQYGMDGADDVTGNISESGSESEEDEQEVDYDTDLEIDMNGNFLYVSVKFSMPYLSYFKTNMTLEYLISMEPGEPEKAQPSRYLTS